MNLVAAHMKQDMAKTGTAIKGETTQNQPDVQLNCMQVRNTESFMSKAAIQTAAFVSSLCWYWYWRQQREVQFRMRLEWDKTTV